MAMGDVLVPVKITLLRLWLEAWLCLSGWPQVGHSQYHSPPEVGIPLRVTGTSRGMRAPGWLSYSLNFGGQRHIIHMKAMKFLVSRDLSVFTYTDQGALLEDHPFVQTNCYYHGYVEGDPESLVSLSTCFGGFQGVLHVKDIAYEIKPRKNSTTFEHLVHKMDNEDTQLPHRRCALTEEEIIRQLKLRKSNNFILMQGSYLGWWTHRLFIEMALVIDYERFRYKGRNVSNVLEEVFIIANIGNSLLRALGPELAIIGLEIWNEGNPIAVGDIIELLENFCRWKVEGLNFRIESDVTELFANGDFDKYFGYAYIGTVCDNDVNCGVIGLLGEEMLRFAITMVHETGHVLGMVHDEKDCTCGHEVCIMFQIQKEPSRFSNCSYDIFWETSLVTTCMLNTPRPLGIFMNARCGNGVVEQDEHCDCGSQMECEKDPCCLADCTMRSGAACAFGLCCKDCQLIPSGTLCREKANECDLPEWCNGSSHECPEDVHMQDGFPCLGNGYCYERRCNQRDEQCRQIFGKDAKNANMSCYMKMNSQGDRFGHCGMNDTEYVRCSNADILCGRVQCKNVTELPLLVDHSTVHWTESDGASCWSTDYHFGMTIPDIGAVTDGTECGPGHVCIQTKCVSTSRWNRTCSPETCNMKGVCNNKQHCHCESEWEPPYCQSSGHGGSIDSGPPLGTHVPPMPSKKNTGLFFFIPFGLLFLCLALWLSMNPKIAVKKEPSAQTAPMAERPGAPSAPVAEQLRAQTAPVAERPRAQTAPVAEGPRAQTAPVAERPRAQTAPVAEGPRAQTAPVAERPRAQSAPVAERPRAQTAPVAEGPRAQTAPVAERPRAQSAPVAERPRAQSAPVAEGPRAQSAPVAERPGAQTAPVAERPGAQTAPVAERPGAQSAPVAERPGAQSAPVAERPGAQTAPMAEGPSAQTAPMAERPRAQSAPVAEQLRAQTGPVAELPSAQTAPVAERPRAQTAPVAERPRAQSAPVAERPRAQSAPVAERPRAQSAPVAERPGAQTAPVAERPRAQSAPVAERPGAQTGPVAERPSAQTAPMAEELNV